MRRAIVAVVLAATSVAALADEPKLTADQQGKALKFAMELSVYLIAGRCAESGLYWTQATLYNMQTAMKDEFRDLPSFIKDEIYTKMKADAEVEPIDVKNCKGLFANAEMVFPSDITVPRTMEKSPF